MNVMNRWQALMGASTLTLSLFAACSGTSNHGTTGQAGSGGSGQAGTAGAPGSSGASNQAGSKSQGGSSQAGSSSSEAGSPTSGSGGEAEGGGAGAPGLAPGTAIIGERCAVDDTIGVVQLAGFPAPYVQVTLYDRRDPWLAAPELATDTCAYHRYTPGVCQGCEAGELCSRESECVIEPRTVKDATLVVSVGGEQREYEADAQLGGIYSMLDIGDADDSFAMTLSWGDTTVTLEPMPVGSGELSELTVDIEGDSSAPGALDATWQPSQQGGFVRSRIPINHHASGPTFTECAAPESAGSFHADADMIDPLAVVTGLEFQGVEHVFIAAAATAQGCVEFRFGPQLYVFPD